jgi:hypothetical protein
VRSCHSLNINGFFHGFSGGQIPSFLSVSLNFPHEKTIPSTTAVTMVNDSPSGSLYPSASPKSGTKIGPIVGGIVAGIVVAILTVAMIVPCARRRQKRQRVVGDGYGGHRVLKKAGDVEATEPMMNGSWRDHSRISDEDRMRSISSGATMVQPGELQLGIAKNQA